MSFGGFHGRPKQAPMAEMNMVPLVDVMLVLLVIFVVTAPLLTHSVRIELPRASSSPNLSQGERIELAIRADGTLFWNGERAFPADVATRLSAAARRHTPPELHIRADRNARYENVAVVMSMAARAGIGRMGFVTEPGEAASP